MTVTASDVGKAVRWVVGRRQHVGELRRVPVPGSAEYFSSRGKATVLLPPRAGSGLRAWLQIRPDELEVFEPYTAPPPGRVLHVLAVDVAVDTLDELLVALDYVLVDLGARQVAAQSSGSNLTLLKALDALARAQVVAGG